MNHRMTHRVSAAIGFAILWLTAIYAHAAEKLPEVGIPQSCGVQLKTHNFTIQTLDRAHDMGFRVVRRGFYWDSIEEEEGVYEFSDYDAQMERAKKLGLTVVGCLFGNNRRYEDDGQGGIQTEAGRKGFAGFAAALAEHYKDHRVLWEVWNEPNVRTFWSKNGRHNSEQFAKEYTALVKETARAMLEADRDCFVMAGSVSNYWEPSYEWTEACFREGILKTGIRGWSVHPYGVKTPEEFAIGHKRMRELLDRYGAPDMPLLNTERGFAVKETLEGWSGGSKQRAREFQAWNFVRQFMIDQLYDVRLTVWYEWGGEEFGLLQDGGSRPVSAACRKMFEQLGGYRLVRRIESDDELDYVLLFEDKEGNRKLVAWTAPPPGGAPDEAKPHHAAIDTRETLAAESGGKRGEGPAAVGPIRVTLTGAPQYLAVPGHVDLARCVALGPASVAGHDSSPGTPTLPAGAVDLKLCESGVEWEFEKNTGEGSFTLGAAEDAKPIGVLAYDFTTSTSRSTPYVLAVTSVDIGEGAVELRIHARSPIAQQLTFRLIDSTEQTHQVKRRIKGTGHWEAVRIPLTGRLEHWGGANDGRIHFPVRSLVFSVPLPREDHRTGKVEYADVAVVPGEIKPAPQVPEPRSLPGGELDLRVCERDAPWEFMRNTGQGSFALGTSDDGQPIGTLEYDFTKSKSRSTPYVLAKTPVRVDEGAIELRIRARSPIAQQLTFRVVDGTGQTHQFKQRTNGSGQWESIRIPLAGRLEHWGGANDGRIHFPIEWLVFSVPLPGEDHKTGKVEYADAVVVRGQ